ncbi:Uncharacterised protein [Vibrio cholerae]|nr:Uncharacterised protein [Vibrio cholerae]
MIFIMMISTRLVIDIAELILRSSIIKERK